MTDTKTETRDYRDTLFLPKTDFPMRGGLPKREPEWIKRWDEMGLYKKMRADAKARGAQQWLLHDGPPYANGHIHLGTAMNKILKDIIVRSRQMAGYDSSYIPGWDCHGLPIEWKVEEEFRGKGRTKDDVPGDEFRKRCREYAQEWVDVQAAEFRSLGVEGEWDDPYLTMNYESEAATVAEFLRVAMQGLLVRGAKPIMWSPVERTALAEAEVEYHDRKVPVIWVKFPVRMHPGLPNQYDDASVVIWTTTPWTIPANQAVSFNPNVKYGVYEVVSVMTEEELGFMPYAKSGERLIIADLLAQSVMDAAKVEKFNRVSDFSIIEPADWKLDHPLQELTGGHGTGLYGELIPLYAGDHVTDDAGTGFVHTAPAHGEDDYMVCIANGMKASDIRDIVNPDGVYEHPDLPERLAGLDIVRTSGKKRGQDGKANQEVIKALAESGNLLARGVTTIRDAHSWRSKAPVIRRATPQWFIAMDKPCPNGKTLRENALAAIDETEFFPATGRTRLRTMVEGRPDWLVSRQRNWGVPLTIFVNAEGLPHTAALEADVAEAINEDIVSAITEGGVQAWFDVSKDEILTKHGQTPDDWEKVTDVLDVWFDSGTTHAFTLRKRGVIDEETGQANMYMEGSDQHRGWFQSSLLECCATRGMAPYKQVLTHGFIVDADGKKMSKSLGNTVEPQQIQKQYGIEILRLWTGSSDVTEDLRISDEIIKTNVESYRRLRNTMRYLLGALDGFSDAEMVSHDRMPGLEQWILHRLAELNDQIRAAYDVYDFKRVMALLMNFCGVDLSAVYFDIRKDSLYCDPAASTETNWDAETAVYGNRRKAVRTTMSFILERLLGWLAPIMPFTTEEAFLQSHMKNSAESIHLTLFPDAPNEWQQDQTFIERWDKIFAVRKVVTGALEIERREKRIGSSLEAAPDVFMSDASMIAAFENESAADIFITSDAKLQLSSDAPETAFTQDDVPGVGVVPKTANGQKCARSWKYFDPATADPDLPDITPRDALAVKAASL